MENSTPCRHCGEPIPEGDTFCPACGAGIYEPLPGEEGDPFAVATTPAPTALRFAARLIDTIVIYLIPVLTLSPYAEENADGQVEFAGVPFWLVPTLVVVIALYEIVPTARVGGTLGKLLVGLRVHDNELDGFISLSASLRRWATFGVLLALSPIFGLGAGLAAYLVLLSAFWMGGRGWPDRAGGTRVVRARKA